MSETSTSALAGRSYVVTGASRGIGLGVAEGLAKAGARLTISARNADTLTRVSSDLKSLGASEVSVVAADLGVAGAAHSVIAQHVSAFGGLDGLIVNAGVGTAGQLFDYPLERLRKTVTVNLESSFVLIQEALPHLRTAAATHASGSRIVALSSITGVYAEPGLAAYGASKAALISLVETLNAEESQNGVSATALAPAFVSTDMSSWATDRVPLAEMIPVADVVALVMMLLGLSKSTVISRIVMNRAGDNAYRA